MTMFYRLVSEDDKETALRAAIRNPNNALTFERGCQSFNDLPGSPFAYWLPARLIAKFGEWPTFASANRTATAGLHTANDERFLRLSYEVPMPESDQPSSQDWVPLMKGGQAVPFFADPVTCVRWKDNGHELKTFATSYRERKGWGGSWTAMINGTEYYFKPGFSWTLRASKFTPVAMPAGCAFSKRGCGGIAPEHDLPWLIALTRSSCFDILFKTLLARAAHPEFASGALQKVPLPVPTKSGKIRLEELFREAWTLCRARYMSRQTSHAFVLPELLLSRTPVCRRGTGRALAEIQQEIDAIGQQLYRLSDGELALLKELLVSQDSQESADVTNGDAYEDDTSAYAESDFAAQRNVLLVASWALGVAFGRFDVRLATGERQVPSEPDPFDTLPTKSSGMLPRGDLPFRPSTGIFVDDPGHSDDIGLSIKAVLQRVGLLIPDELGFWLWRELFPLHISMYSESHRKAPIYWQLATSSASYSVWLYYHRLMKDTFYTVLNDYVGPKLQHEERRLATLTAESGANPSAAQRRQIAERERFVEELRAFREEIARVAPLWNPDLNDGVIINFAPLWRLVPQHRAWQRECKACWDKLVAGDYDWAHLAMHLWPERVVPKCAEDRSLAIAHGLEEVFWFEDSDGKWKRRDVPARPIEELVRERTSLAVKAALKSLLEAPAPDGGGNGRARHVPRRQRRTAGSLR